MPTHSAFDIQSEDAIDRFIGRHPFATMVSNGKEQHVNHGPVIARRQSGRLILSAHVARSKPQCLSIQDGEGLLTIFHGPHAYISPAWYVTAPAVPTWNYGVIHVKGIPRPIDHPSAMSGYFRELAARFEGSVGLPPEVMPPALIERLSAAIQLFEITADSVEVKFRLGQNRSPEDQAATRKKLGERAAPGDLELAAFMEEFGGSKAGS